MGVLLGGYRMLVPLSNVWLALLAVVIGGAMYVVLILKLDRKICDELHGIVEGVGMGVVWPGWL
jgi:hypothetical protein